MASECGVTVLPFLNRRITDVTKAEFLEKVAGDERIGSRRPRLTPSTPSGRDYRHLTAGGEVNFTGFGKFHVAERSARQV